MPFETKVARLSESFVVRNTTRRDCEYLHPVFAVPPLGGIEPERSGEILVKTGTTNGANPLVKHMPNSFTASPSRLWCEIRLGESSYYQ